MPHKLISYKVTCDTYVDFLPQTLNASCYIVYLLAPWVHYLSTITFSGPNSLQVSTVQAVTFQVTVNSKLMIGVVHVY